MADKAQTRNQNERPNPDETKAPNDVARTAAQVGTTAAETGQRQTEATADAAREAMNRSAEAARQAGAAGAETARRVSETGSEAARSVSDAGANLVEGATGAAHQATRRMVEQFGRFTNVTAPEAEQGLRVAQAGAQAAFQVAETATRAGQEIASAWASYGSGSMQRQARFLAEVARIRSAADLFRAQGEYVREEFETFLKQAVEVSERSNQLVHEVAGNARQIFEQADRENGRTEARAEVQAYRRTFIGH